MVPSGRTGLHACCLGLESATVPSMNSGPWWSQVTLWVVVNLVNVAQTVGFASRRRYGMRINRAAGLLIAVLAVPATAAMIGMMQAGSPWWIGAAVFDAFVVLMLVVDYLRPVEFRNPAKPAILALYVVLFFGSILLMGLAMFDVNRSLWGVTAATSGGLLVSMVLALRQGVG